MILGLADMEDLKGCDSLYYLAKGDYRQVSEAMSTETGRVLPRESFRKCGAAWRSLLLGSMPYPRLVQVPESRRRTVSSWPWRRAVENIKVPGGGIFLASYIPPDPEILGQNCTPPKTSNQDGGSG